ncbi:hypothetical protein AB0E59_47070 [Lentzea sp. NPDC034063]|uniref:hypothetical protein n=1 Tax=unclassified Lentzea TaxID=2643253 RepID=UPI0033C30C43
MPENLFLQIGDLCGVPRDVGHPDRFEVKFILGFNNDRRFIKDTGRWDDGTATFLDVVCSGTLAKNVLESNWTTGLKIMVYGHLTNNDSFDHEIGKTIPAFTFKAIHAGPSARRGPVTAIRERKARYEPVRAGDMFPQVARALEEMQRRRTAPAAETLAAA